MTAHGEAERGYRRCAGIMLLNARNEVFVARRRDMPSAAWQMPQGGIDDGETPAEAALRELREEIGTDRAEIIAESLRWFSYDLPAELADRLWGGRYRGQTQKWFALRFTGGDADIDLETHEPEFIEWKWIAPEMLPEVIVPFKRRLYAELLLEFRDVLAAPAPEDASGMGIEG